MLIWCSRNISYIINVENNIYKINLFRKNALKGYFTQKWEICHQIWAISVPPLTTTQLPLWRFKKFIKDHKTNPYELSGLVQIFWRDTIALYDEQI